MALDDLLARLEGRAVTSVTSGATADVTLKPAQLLACTSVTSVTAEKNDTGTDALEPGAGDTADIWRSRAQAHPPEPLSTQDEATIRAWLEYIGETDPEELARVWERCRTRLDARAYVLAQAAQMPATASPAGRVAMLEEVPAMGTTRHLAAIQRPDVRAAADAFHHHLAHRGGPCGLQACAEIPGIDP